MYYGESRCRKIVVGLASIVTGLVLVLSFGHIHIDLECDAMRWDILTGVANRKKAREALCNGTGPTAEEEAKQVIEAMEGSGLLNHKEDLCKRAGADPAG